jgi:hypothetical protein
VCLSFSILKARRYPILRDRITVKGPPGYRPDASSRATLPGLAAALGVPVLRSVFARSIGLLGLRSAIPQIWDEPLDDLRDRAQALVAAYDSPPPREGARR